MHKKSYLEKENKIYQHIKDRRYIAWIARLRTGHYVLNKYLHRLNIINDSNCGCEEKHEMMKYYLLKYSLYEKKKERMRKKMKIEEMRMSKLLDDLKLIQYIIQFIIDIKRFDF